jgi:DNA polymerase-1
MNPKKRLFLIDAYALIFRGYYAFIKNPRINSQGLDTSAILGFTNSLLDVIKRERPEYLAVCFDKGGSVLRQELFTDYKANRDETPEAIKIAVPYIEQLLEAMHIPVIVKPGFEADDIIGTLAKKAEQEGFDTYMVTPDKDFAQLVSEHIFMYRPVFGGGYETWGIPEVQKKFEVERPEQVIDFLGMMGDSADNIPGLPGVGEKTAKKFIKAYGSMEGLLENTHELKGKMKERVEENAELGRLSKDLARILLDVPVEFQPDKLIMEAPDVPAVTALFETLEFRRLTQNFINTFSKPDASAKTQTGAKSESSTPTSGGGAQADSGGNTESKAGSGQFSLFDQLQEEVSSASSRQNIENTSHFYQILSPGLALDLLNSALAHQKEVALHLLTDSDDAMTASLVAIGFSYKAHSGYVLPLPQDKNSAITLLKHFTSFFENDTIGKIGQNLKSSLKILSRYGINLKGPLFDTMLAHYLINPDMRHDPVVLSENYLNYRPIDPVDLRGKSGKKQKKFWELTAKEVTDFTAEMADITFQLRTHFLDELNQADTLKLYQNVEIPLLRVLADMELEGVNLDVSYLSGLAQNLETDIAELQKSIYAQAGTEFNIASPKQLGQVLFEQMNLVDKPKKTKTGQYSTAEDVLSNLAKDHQIIREILEFRGLSKLKSTYVDALPNVVNSDTGRVHTDYMQTVAATGRLSSNNPNLQNIPIRTERGRAIRKAFVPKNQDYLLMAADYSQIELRIIAALSQESTMIDAFKRGEDIHAATAAQVFQIPLEEVTREQRSHAKTVNFGIIYGVSAFGLSNQTDLTRSESKELIETYYATYPKLKAYIGEQVNFARNNGYVQTVSGRRRYLKDINSRNAVVRGAAERNAVNAPIQGSAADIIKIAMINIHKALEKSTLRSKMLLQVHDELVFDVYKPEMDELVQLVRRHMQEAYTLEVPLEVDVGQGSNWLEAH